MSTLTLDIPDGLKQEFDDLSQEQQNAVEETVRETLRRQIALEHFRRVREITVPLAQKAGYFTDEDIFREVS